MQNLSEPQVLQIQTSTANESPLDVDNIISRQFFVAKAEKKNDSNL